MPKFNVARKKLIKAPIDKVYKTIADMSSWPKWSPWLIMEPEANVNVSNDGRSYSWKGSRTGEGIMKITQTEENKLAMYDLNFLKPWKSEAKVGMHLSEKDGGTEVKWTLDSSLPFFMFWMTKQMTTFIGMDYDRGLNLLKDLMEDGKINSKLNFIGEEDFPGCDYICIERECNLSQMPNKMKEDFEKIMAYAATKPEIDPTKAFSIYHKYDPVKNKAAYTAGIPSAGSESLPSGFTRGTIAPTKVYTLEHVGPYEHLGNAWSTIESMKRNKEFKAKKGMHPFETYGNSPMDTDPNDLITRIHYPF